MGAGDDDSRRAAAKLPRGSHGLPPEFVAHSQRERLFVGMARVMVRIGYAATTVDDIAVESAVSRKALYTHFSGKEDLLLQAHRSVVERIVAGAGPSMAEQRDWRGALRTLLDWGLEFFAREPAFAHLSLVEVPAATPASRRLQRESLALLRRMIEPAIDGDSAIPVEVTIDGLIGGLGHVIAQAAEDGAPQDLPSLRPQLMAWFALAIEGRAAAAEELAHEVTLSPTLATSAS